MPATSSFISFLRFLLSVLISMWFIYPNWVYFQSYLHSFECYSCYMHRLSTRYGFMIIIICISIYSLLLNCENKWQLTNFWHLIIFRNSRGFTHKLQQSTKFDNMSDMFVFQIQALMVEGPRRRAYRGRRPNSANYHKLDSNLEEAISSSCKKNSSHIIY